MLLGILSFPSMSSISCDVCKRCALPSDSSPFIRWFIASCWRNLSTPFCVSAKGRIYLVCFPNSWHVAFPHLALISMSILVYFSHNYHLFLHFEYLSYSTPMLCGYLSLLSLLYALCLSLDHSLFLWTNSFFWLNGSKNFFSLHVPTFSTTLAPRWVSWWRLFAV